MFQIRSKSHEIRSEILSKVGISCCDLLKRVVSSEWKTVPFMKTVIFSSLMQPVLAKGKSRINLMMVGLIFILMSVLMALARIVLAEGCCGKKDELNEEGENEGNGSCEQIRAFLLEVLAKLSVICFFIGMPFIIGALN